YRSVPAPAPARPGLTERAEELARAAHRGLSQEAFVLPWPRPLKGFGLDAGPGLAAWRTGALDITTAAAPGLGGRGARWVLLAHTGLAAAGELTDTDDAAIAELFALAAAAAIAPKGVHLRLHTAHAQAATAAARAR